MGLCHRLRELAALRSWIRARRAGFCASRPSVPLETMAARRLHHRTRADPQGGVRRGGSRNRDRGSGGTRIA